MQSVVFVDTSILLNILDVPRKNSHREAVLAQFVKERITSQLVLPITTVIETGNHISQIDGGARRGCAVTFARMLEQVIRREAPFVLHETGWDSAFMRDLVAGGVTGTPLTDLLTAGDLGCGDLSILVERERFRAQVASGLEVRIWSLDAGLMAYA